MLNDLWLLVSFLLVIIGLVASQGLLIVVGSLVIIIWLLTKFWNRFAFRDVTHSRSLSRHRAFIGDTLDYTISLTNEKIVPLIWVDIQDSFPAELELLGASLRGTGTELTKEHRITSSLLPYQRVSWKYSLRCDHRGYHRIGPARLRSGDIFGFTATEVHLTQVEHLLVYPRLVELEQLVWPSEHPLGESKGHLPIYQDSSRFIGLRDYDPSDPMKHIDWKATARRSTIQTKKYEPVVALKVLIALNARTSEHAWQGANRRLFERAVTVAASLAKHCSDQRFSFGLLSNGVAVYSGKWINLRISNSGSQLDLVLESLAMAGQYAVASLLEVLRAERASMPSGTTVAIVTSLLTNALAEEIREIKSRGYQVVVFYSGDGAPRMEVPGVPLFQTGRGLDTVEKDEQVRTE